MPAARGARLGDERPFQPPRLSRGPRAQRDGGGADRLRAGTLRQLDRLGIAPAALTDVLFSHAHLDHTADLWPLLFYSRIPPARRARLRLHGSPAFFDFYHRVAAAFGSWVEAEGYELEEIVHRGPAVSVGEAQVSAHPVSHIDSSIAYRFEAAAKVLVISGDTDYDARIVARRAAPTSCCSNAPRRRRQDGRAPHAVAVRPHRRRGGDQAPPPDPSLSVGRCGRRGGPGAPGLAGEVAVAETS